MSGAAVDWDAVQIAQGVRLPGVALPRYRRCDCILQYEACPGDCLRAKRETRTQILDATRVIYRALKIHHSTAHMAAVALYHAGLLK